MRNAIELAGSLIALSAALWSCPRRMLQGALLTAALDALFLLLSLRLLPQKLPQGLGRCVSHRPVRRYLCRVCNAVAGHLTTRALPAAAMSRASVYTDSLTSTSPLSECGIVSVMSTSII